MSMVKRKSWLPLMAACLLIPAAAAAETAALRVRISGIEQLAGEIVIAVFDTEVSFDERQDPVACAYLAVDADVMTWSAELAAPAEYAVAVYHDLNGNRELDMRRLGGPREPYGFSNNIRGVFGPPDYADVRIKLGSEPLSLDITIR